MVTSNNKFYMPGMFDLIWLHDHSAKQKSTVSLLACSCNFDCTAVQFSCLWSFDCTAVQFNVKQHGRKQSKIVSEVLIAPPSPPSGAPPPEHPGRSQPPPQAVERHHPRPFIASSTLDPTPHPNYRVSFSPTWAPWDDHIIKFKITTWSMYLTASPCITTWEVQKYCLRVHLNHDVLIGVSPCHHAPTRLGGHDD